MSFTTCLLYAYSCVFDNDYFVLHNTYKTKYKHPFNPIIYFVICFLGHTSVSVTYKTVIYSLKLNEKNKLIGNASIIDTVKRQNSTTLNK